MCTLYTTRKSRDEVAQTFRARRPPIEPNLPDDILPGGPGLVVREADGERILQPLHLQAREIDDLVAFLESLSEPPLITGTGRN